MDSETTQTGTPVDRLVICGVSMRDTRLQWLAEHEPDACSLDEVRRMATEILRLRATLRELKEYAAAHHADEGSHVWLHSLTVDIPHRIDFELSK